MVQLVVVVVVVVVVNAVNELKLIKHYIRKYSAMTAYFWRFFFKLASKTT